MRVKTLLNCRVCRTVRGVGVATEALGRAGLSNGFVGASFAFDR
ncbi:hypothetical protein BMS3Abin02_00331 [bacterium BMS3Abin02]|nr:hypothetical protein BMS3Abin02_00331 [bacterium BMS3Abin02]GBE23700.1 hypothetical protein BMS3Bbin01_03086 [bacterium BMS3Bbin01]